MPDGEVNSDLLNLKSFSPITTHPYISLLRVSKIYIYTHYATAEKQNIFVLWNLRISGQLTFLTSNMALFTLKMQKLPER